MKKQNLLSMTIECAKKTGLLEFSSRETAKACFNFSGLNSPTLAVKFVKLLL